MRYFKQRAAAIACGLGLCIFSSFGASAQSLTSGKPLTLVIPFGAGGPTDVTGRVLAKELSQRLGIAVVVENRPGGSTIIAADHVARSQPDGHTLLYTQDATISVNPLLFNKLPYDPERDLTPVSMILESPEFLMISSKVPVRTFQEFVDYVKQRPGALNYGSFGAGSGPHLAAAGLLESIGLEMEHIPYKGSTQLIQGLITGEVQMYMSAIGQAVAHVKSGDVVPLASMTPERHPAFPDVPTLKELGVVGFEDSVWLGIFAPAKTPSGVIDKLAEEIGEIVTTPEFKANALDPFYFEAPKATGVEHFMNVLAADKKKYKSLVEAANVKLDY